MKFLPALIVSAFIVTSSLVACGDDSSSAFPDAVGDLPSSSAESDDAPASSGDLSSSSSVKSSSSEDSKNSSSSAKSSSSENSSAGGSNAKSSSSLNSSGDTNSSSSVWTEPCSSEGEIIHMTDRQTREDVMYICQDGFYVPYIRSSSSAKSSNSRYNMDSLYNSKKSYGEFVDPRDGQKYRTLHIKTSWLALPEFDAFAQNLNYGAQIKLDATEFDDGKVEKYCYKDDPWYCDNGFGGLYSWSEAFGLPKACDSVWTGTTPACPDSLVPGDNKEIDSRDLFRQGACPEGWHVMNGREWMALKSLDPAESGSSLISAVCGKGNEIGFSALFGGMAEVPAQYTRIWDIGVYHLAFEYEAGRHKSVTMSKSTNLSYDGIHAKIDGLSVRCVKDY